jgi:hypothetical protein
MAPRNSSPDRSVNPSRRRRQIANMTHDDSVREPKGTQRRRLLLGHRGDILAEMRVGEFLEDRPVKVKRLGRAATERRRAASRSAAIASVSSTTRGGRPAAGGAARQAREDQIEIVGAGNPNQIIVPRAFGQETRRDQPNDRSCITSAVSGRSAYSRGEIENSLGLIG